MRSVFSHVQRRAIVLAVVALLLIPIAGLADDPQIEPPRPQSVLQPVQPSVWNVLLVVIANCRIVPFLT